VSGETEIGPPVSAMTKIDTQTFRRRLAQLCLQSGRQGWPTKQRDRLIVLKSAALALEAGRTYREVELDEVLQQWVADVGRSLGVDHVALRRYLVDHGFLDRDPYGHAYQLCSSVASEHFDQAVEQLSSVQIIHEAAEEREIRRRRHASGE